MEPWVKLCQKYHPEIKIVGLTFMATPGAMLIVEALKRSGKDLTREKFIDTLESIENFETGVVPYPVSLSKTDHRANKRGTFFHMKPDKTIVAIGDQWK
jgi:branched-chain amino acid transport system substrate-binding protein